MNAVALRRLALALGIVALGLIGLLSEPMGGIAGAQAPAGKVVLLDIDGPIGPAVSDYVVRGLATAAADGATLVVLRMDTPGGLDTSMREIIRAILASPVPVASFVAPSGARAASAGTYILYASHVAAMAPGTNLGAATPVEIAAPGLPGGPEGDGQHKPGEGGAEARHPGMAEKVTNDAAAYIRGLAEMRGRNAEWAEKAVREAASLSAEASLDRKVIDVMAADVPALLRAINGRAVTAGGRTVELATAGAEVAALPPDWRTRLLAVIANPNVASLLMLIGVYALIFEFYTPGLGASGIAGAICILLALYAFHVLPVDYAGLALLMLGIAMMVAEAFIGAFGALGVGGLVAFVAGTILLMKEEAPGFTMAWEILGGLAVALGGLFMLVGAAVMRARRQPPAAGREQMVGSNGPVLSWHGHEGRVRVHGEVWRARSQARLRPGQQVRVSGIDGLTLDVEPQERERADHGFRVQ